MKAFIILAILITFSFLPSYAQGDVNPSDRVNAAMLSGELPKECDKATTIRDDGTVVVAYACPGKNGKLATGIVCFKDGKITEVK